MAILPQPADQDFYWKMLELKWSSTEKAIARRCFARALQQELDAAIQSTKEMAAKIRQASELWELEHHLTQLRKEIDRKYEYKYSLSAPACSWFIIRVRAWTIR
jgi:Photoprotection regulator fluorescence recovery protein